MKGESIMYDEETIWFNQRLFSFKDLEFNTNSTIELSLSSNTKNYKDFSQLSLNLSIIPAETKERKTCNLSYQDVYDLITTFSQIGLNGGNDFFTQGIEIAKKYKGKILKINFKQETFRVIQIGIFTSNTDYLYILINLLIFKSILNLVKNFLDNYIQLSCNFINRDLISLCLDELKGVKGSINTLPSSLVINPSNYTSDLPIKSLYEYEKESFQSSEVDSTLETEFNQFLGGNEMNNIKIEDVKSEVGQLLEEKKNIDEIKSELISNLLGNKIENMEELINSFSVKENPFSCFIDFINNGTSTYGPALKNIIPNDFKALSYVSKLLYTSLLKSYLVNGQRIPSGFPILYYKETEDNDIAYDLLLIISYIKNLRERLTMTTQDDHKNKSCFYMGLRCFTDPLIFSYLYNKDPQIISNNISIRYNYFVKQGFFDSFNKLIVDCNVKSIDLNNIIETCLNMCSAAKDSSTIEKLVKTYNEQKKIILPYENDFSLEQILNEIVFLETSQKLGENMSDVNNMKKYISNPSVELEALFSNKGTVVVKKDKEEKKEQTNLLRYLITYRDQIPENIREKFLKLIEIEYETEPFSFKKHLGEFTFEKFGQNVIKSLYVWDPKNNTKTTKSYKEFFTRAESSIIDIDSFLSGLTTQDDEKEVDYSKWVENIF
jgi:hypothetical protein